MNLKEHFTCISHFDGLPLDAIIMAPSHPIGIIQISHGMCEHKERYFHFMRFLNAQGYVCLIHDHVQSNILLSLESRNEAVSGSPLLLLSLLAKSQTSSNLSCKELYLNI